MRLLPWVAEMTSSPKAKIPGRQGASSTLKLDSQRNHFDHSRRSGSKRGSIPFRSKRSPTICERLCIPSAPLDWYFHGLGSSGLSEKAFGTVTAWLTFAGQRQVTSARNHCPNFTSGIATVLLYVVPVNI